MSTALSYRKLGRSTAIYTATNFLQKGLSFLLLPLYTRYLSPADYGILAVAGAIAAMLSPLFGLSLQAAATRFYFTYRDQPQVLREFWGTVFVLVLAISAVLALALLAFGPYLLAPAYGTVAFWPYVALAIAATALQPASSIFLAILQTREQPGPYALHSMMQFGLTVSMILALVIGFGWRAEGPLAATLLTYLLYAFVSLYALRREVRWCFRPDLAWSALRYSVPLVPHLGASQVAALSDRLVLNHLVSTAASGLYSVGALFAGAISVIADGINRAYVPAAMAGLQSGDQDSLRRMRDLGVSLVTLLSLAAAALSLFAREILGVMTGSAFGDSHLVVPLIAFGFAFSGAYYLFVNILFFDVTLTRLVSLITVGAALLGVVLSYALVSAFGIVGASAAVFLTQAAMAALAAALGARHERVDWDYRRTFMVPIMCLVAVLAGIEAQPAMPVLALLVKSSVWLALAAAVLLGLRGDPAQLVPGWFALVASRARQAASRNRS